MHDFALKGLAGVHHVVRDSQLFTDAGGIHQAFGTTGALATHQPEGEALHVPAGFDQKCSGERTVHASGEADRHPVLARPMAQTVQSRLPSLGGRAVGGAGEAAHQGCRPLPSVNSNGLDTTASPRDHWN